MRRTHAGVLVRLPLLLCAVWLAVSVRPAVADGSAAGAVTLLRTPNGGIQPQAAVDPSGVLHVIYFVGDPAHGDVYYVRKRLGANTPFSPPMRVNSRAGSAIAIGTIRGAQLAIGAGNRVYVAWNGSDQATEPKGGSTPMLFTRLNDPGTAFEPERNLITWAYGIDGGGTVAADRRGDVYVAWHATPAGAEEAAGGVYVARSTDSGRTFAREEQVKMPPVGACGCCGMRALADDSGGLYLLYRSAKENRLRDTMLLVSPDRGRSFRVIDVQSWGVNVCPMSLFSLAPAGLDIIGAWETQGTVYHATLPHGAASFTAPIAAPGAGNSKYPVAVTNARGERLVAWVDGAGWKRVGSLTWQVYGANGRPTSRRGSVPGGVPVWSLTTAVARPDGGFLILY